MQCRAGDSRLRRGWGEAAESREEGRGAPVGWGRRRGRRAVFRDAPGTIFLQARLCPRWGCPKPEAQAPAGLASSAALCSPLRLLGAQGRRAGSSFSPKGNFPSQEIQVSVLPEETKGLAWSESTGGQEVCSSQVKEVALTPWRAHRAHPRRRGAPGSEAPAWR